MSINNTITIIGNIGQEPELRHLNWGDAISFSVGVNKKGYMDKPDTVSWFNCTATNDLALNIANTLHQGNRVIVTGELIQRTWEGADGQKQSKLEIVIEGIGPDLRFNTAKLESHISKPSRTPQPRIVTQEEYSF
jgi:single-strand DNA-binding protein